MPASRVQVEVPDGLRSLFCLACGAPVYTEEEGQAEHGCDHVRFFIDWNGELSLADPEGSSGADVALQQAIVDVVEATANWDEFLTKVAEVLPASVVVMEITKPASPGQKKGARAVVAFDIAQRDDEI